MNASSRPVLVIDDDVKLVELLSSYLGQHGYEAVCATTPSLGLALLKKRRPELVIVDVMLPEKNGFEVVKDIRKDSDVPILMLTARGEVTDRIVGLELGADDYLPKPFEPRELLARMEAILRRGEARGARGDKWRFGDLVIDLGRREATLVDAALDLSTIEFDALVAFAATPGRVLTREQLLDQLKGADWATVDRSIDVVVSRLRGKLKDDPKTPRFIKTVWGTGYTFIAKREG